MRIIALEGINTAGKSSIGSLIREACLRKGLDCVQVDTLGFGPIGKTVRELVVNPVEEFHPNLDAMLFASLRTEGAETLLRSISSPSSTTVVLERWSLALAAFGATDGADPHLLKELRRMLSETLEVNLTILLDITGKVAMERIQKKPERNRFEERGEEYLERLAASYRDIAKREANTTIVDSSGELRRTFALVRTIVEL
jgi:dTMP kinase